MKASQKTVMVLFCILLPITLLLCSYQLVLHFKELTPAQEKVFLFLENKEDLPLGFTDLERSHLEDVKKVMHYAKGLFFILLVFLASIMAYYKKEQKLIFKMTDYGGKSTLLAMLAIGTASLFFFNALFSLFHHIFFPQGNWTFAPESLLIQTFPLSFFVHLSRNIFLLTLGWAILFILWKYSQRYVYAYRS